MSYVTLEPTGTSDVPSAVDRAVAARPASLDGAVIGLLANGKTNSEELLECVYDELARHFDLAGALRYRKDSVSIPPRPEDFERLVSDATVVVTAIGD